MVTPYVVSVPAVQTELRPSVGGLGSTAAVTKPRWRLPLAVQEHLDEVRRLVDIDEPADLVEVLLHGERETPAWLRDRGGRAETTDGRTQFRLDGRD